MANKRNGTFFLILVYFLGILYFSANIPLNDAVLRGQYLCVLMSYLVMFPIILYFINRMGIYLFEPFTMVIGLTFMTYSVGPMMSVILDDLTINGFNVFDGSGCYMATLTYMSATMCFLVVYYSKSKYTINQRNTIEELKYSDEEPNNISLILLVLYILFFIGFAVNIYDMVNKGYNVKYLLTLGMQGEKKPDIAAESLGGLASFGMMIFVPLMYLDKYEKHKWIPRILRLIAIVVALTRGTRFPVIVLVISPIVMYFTERKKSPKSSTVLAIVLLGILIVGGGQMIRTGTRMGGGLEGAAWDQFNFAYIYKTFQGNFDMYKTLYAAVSYFPNKGMFTFGQQLLFCTMIWMIPRAIYPSKPMPYAMEVIKSEWMGVGAVSAHIACGQLTEYYFEFGFLGCCILMGLFGRFCQFLKSKYMNPKNAHDLIFYSIMFPTLMQLIIRGATQLNFWAIFFMMIPWIAAKMIEKINFR